LANWEIGRTVPALHVLPAVIAFLGYSPLPQAQSFADRLRCARLSRGLDQRGLAHALRVPFNTLRCWELGSVQPKPARKALIEERLAALA
jgi:DNA-binding XRE family transcriptional regulator